MWPCTSPPPGPDCRVLTPSTHELHQGCLARRGGPPWGPVVERRRGTFSGAGRKRLCSTSWSPGVLQGPPSPQLGRPRDGAVLQTGRAACRADPCGPEPGLFHQHGWPQCSSLRLWQTCALPITPLLGTLARDRTAPDSPACGSHGTSSGARTTIITDDLFTPFKALKIL